MLESCRKIIKQDLWNCNSLVRGLPDSDDAADPRSGGGLGVVGAILEAILYRPNYRPFVVPMCSVQSFGCHPCSFKSFRIAKPDEPNILPGYRSKSSEIVAQGSHSFFPFESPVLPANSLVYYLNDSLGSVL